MKKEKQTNPGSKERTYITACGRYKIIGGTKAIILNPDDPVNKTKHYTEKEYKEFEEITKLTDAFNGKRRPDVLDLKRFFEEYISTKLAGDSVIDSLTVDCTHVDTMYIILILKNHYGRKDYPIMQKISWQALNYLFLWASHGEHIRAGDRERGCILLIKYLNTLLDYFRQERDIFVKMCDLRKKRSDELFRIVVSGEDIYKKSYLEY